MKKHYTFELFETEAGAALRGTPLAVYLAEEADTEIDRHRSLLRQALNHWAEFGAEYGFDELMDSVSRAVASDGTTSNTNAITFPAPTAEWGKVVDVFIFPTEPNEQAEQAADLDQLIDLARNTVRHSPWELADCLDSKDPPPTKNENT